MIAGVAGIDMVLFVIAADDGFMPQSKEHLEILSLLAIEKGFIVITKIDRADAEMLDLLVEDLKENIKHTFLENAPIYFVDSLSNKGISTLKEALREELIRTSVKNRHTSFRLPIDQVFTIKGQGVVVRGTVYDGEVREGDQLTLLPSNKKVRVKQIQRHNNQHAMAYQGQRAALNISGITKEEVFRGDVLVTDDFFSVTDRIDIVFYPLKDYTYSVKQRQSIKFYIGTSEVMGKIIFFDRNEIQRDKTEEILCQVHLNEKVIVAREDRFIIRNPSPIETIGGGWVIDPNAKKHRFGVKTIDFLRLTKDGSIKDRTVFLLQKNLVLTKSEIIRRLSITETEFDKVKKELITTNGLYTLPSTLTNMKDKIIKIIQRYHEKYPMRMGINKAELFSNLRLPYLEEFMELVLGQLEAEKRIEISCQYVSLVNFTPSLPSKWKVQLEEVENKLNEQMLEVEKWEMILHNSNTPAHIQKEFYHFLIESKRAYKLDKDRLISKKAVEEASRLLYQHTQGEDFTLQTAKDVLQLTRKNLIPLLELFDELKYTKRKDNVRMWLKR